VLALILLQSGVRTSGVILTTAIRLYDLDYNVYIISDNVIETAPDNGIHKSILERILPKFVGMQVISSEQALAALERS
jgi:nicotinamidase-related amidase